MIVVAAVMAVIVMMVMIVIVFHNVDKPPFLTLTQALVQECAESKRLIVKD